ncbi:hypothetical protein [Pseudoalteromonas sp. GB56]
MYTKFKLIFSHNPPDIDFDLFNQSLPAQMQAYKESDGIYIKVKSEIPEDIKCQYLVDRELDRHRFLTAVDIKAEMVTRTIIKDITLIWGIHSKLPNDISSQTWSADLATQLRLWSLASDADDYMLKIILYFQIIELSHPFSSSFPQYLNSNIAPNPLTEAKLIRHLVAHSGEVSSSQLKKYCDYLGIPELMFDPTEVEHMEIIKNKVPLLKAEAKKVIETAL